MCFSCPFLDMSHPASKISYSFKKNTILFFIEIRKLSLLCKKIFILLPLSVITGILIVDALYNKRISDFILFLVCQMHFIHMWKWYVSFKYFQKTLWITLVGFLSIKLTCIPAKILLDHDVLNFYTLLDLFYNFYQNNLDLCLWGWLVCNLLSL